MKAFIVNRIGDLGFVVGIALVFLQFGSIEFADDFRRRSLSTTATPTRCSASTWRAYEVIGSCCSSARWASRRRSAARLAAGRDGRPDAGLRADPRRHDGDGRRLPGRAHVAAVRATRRRARLVTFIGAHDRVLRRDHRLRAERHQARDGLLDLLAARLHDRRGRRRRLSGAIFHLITHAFFKALLFLGCGLGDPRDVRTSRTCARWADSGSKMPMTYAMMWIGSLALAGVFPFAGYFSKDAISRGRLRRRHRHRHLRLLAAAARRLPDGVLLLAPADHDLPRHAARRSSCDGAVHESPFVMSVPLIVLAIGATVNGFSFRTLFIGDEWREFWREPSSITADNHVLEAMEHLPGWVGRPRP